MNFIIIDANIARSCSEPSNGSSSADPTSSQCFKLTQVLRDKAVEVGVALSPEMEREWIKHASKFFVKWWAIMESRGKLRREVDVRVNDYRNSLRLVSDADIVGAMLKDAHIVELSLLKNYPVASRDSKQRRYVKNLSESYHLLKKIQWFDPVESRGWEDWLRSGCADNNIYCEVEAE